VLIDSGYQGFGFFGQICSWILDLLPYCDSQGWNRAHWCIRSKLYGDTPNYNIFDSVIQTAYQPEDEPAGRVMFEDLHWKFNPQDGAGRHFGGDFVLANKFWTSYFRWAPFVTDLVDNFFEKTGLGNGTLGLHYRGTDQFVIHNESNAVTIAEFLLILEDYLSTHPDVENIFACSDDWNFEYELKAFCRGSYEVFMHDHSRSRDGTAFYMHHGEEHNRGLAVEAIRDCVSLSRCQYLLANYSALSAWAKVLNPDLVSHRISACKIFGTENGGAFPHGYAPFYPGKSPEARKLIANLRIGDWQDWTETVKRQVAYA
jgi:hypothetical protein